MEPSSLREVLSSATNGQSKLNIVCHPSPLLISVNRGLNISPCLCFSCKLLGKRRIQIGNETHDNICEDIETSTETVTPNIGGIVDDGEKGDDDEDR